MMSVSECWRNSIIFWNLEVGSGLFIICILSTILLLTAGAAVCDEDDMAHLIPVAATARVYAEK